MREPTSKLPAPLRTSCARRGSRSTLSVLGALGLLSGGLWACGLPADGPLAGDESGPGLGQHAAALTVDGLDETTAVIGRPPSLTRLEPALGPDTGGIEVTLTGRNFRPGLRVDFAGTPASTVTVVSSTLLRAYLPAKPGLLGRVPVRITLPDGRFVERADLFAYYSDDLALRPPRVTPTNDSSDLVLGDLDKDGKLDVIASSSTSDSISVFLGAGNHGFRSIKSHAAGDSPSAVTLADT